VRVFLFRSCVTFCVSWSAFMSPWSQPERCFALKMVSEVRDSEVRVDITANADNLL
jgi:hypothetical protein